MLREPVRESARAAMRSGTFPVPSRGWNTRDPVGSMRSTDALRIRNGQVRPKGVESRPGRVAENRAIGGTPTAIITLEDTLFACTETEIVDTGGAIDTLTGLTSGDWIGDVLSGNAGTFLIAANGADGVRVCDGSEWLTSTITGVTATELFSVVVHQDRAFFPATGTLDVWYLPTHAIEGTAEILMLGPLCRRGGSIAAIGTMTQDAGRNAGDQLVVVTTEGECVVYSGIDPDKSAETWGLRGVFTLPKPVGGKRALAGFGGDLLLLTEKGVIRLPEALSRAEAEKEVRTMSDRIDPTIQAEVLNAGNITGAWQVIEAPNDRVVVVNVPGASEPKQFIYQTETGAWSEWAVPGLVWGVRNKKLYCGTSDGAIWEMSGDSDDGEPITLDVVHAYQRLGTSMLKTMVRARPDYTAPEGATARVTVLEDHADLAAGYASSTVARGRPLWGALTWTGWVWERNTSRKWAWRGISGRGHAIALQYALQSTGTVSYEGTEVGYQVGGRI